MKLKCPLLLKPLVTIVQENFQSFYPSEPFRIIHFTMRHPVCNYIQQATLRQTVLYFLTLLNLVIYFEQIFFFHQAVQCKMSVFLNFDQMLDSNREHSLIFLSQYVSIKFFFYNVHFILKFYFGQNFIKTYIVHWVNKLHTTPWNKGFSWVDSCFRCFLT